MTKLNFSPKLQKYINEKTEAKFDVGLVIGVLSLSMALTLSVWYCVLVIFGLTPFLEALASISALIIMFMAFGIKLWVVNKNNLTAYDQIKKNTFDYQSIKNYQQQTQIISTIRIIINYKIERALSKYNAISAFVYGKQEVIVLISLDEVNPTIKNSISKDINTEFGYELSEIILEKGHDLKIRLSLNQLGTQLLKEKDVL